MRKRKTPFFIRVLPLFGLVYVTFIAWWWSMSATMGEGFLVTGLSIGYSMPIVVTLLALLASKGGKASSVLNLLPLLSLILLALVYFGTILLLGRGDQVTWVVPYVDAQGKPATQMVTQSVFSDVAPLIGVGLISSVMSIMLFPAAGALEYYRYRTVLFVGGVIFMPLFVVISVILRSPASLLDKAWLLAAAMIGFWASAAWLASRGTQGRHTSGLEIRPGLPFRPDLILPGGVNYVKGVIMTGVGMMIMFQESLTLPRWNWWGFVLAFWGIITIIPLRGMYKMFFGRRRRFVGDPAGSGFIQGLIKGNLLFVGLLILLYGFLTAFMGVVPFVGLLPKGDLLPQALALIAASYVVLVVLRESYKRSLREGIETFLQSIIKLLILYVGTLLLLYGYITLFMGRWMVVHPDTNPMGFALGLGLFLSGLVLIVPVRHRALRNEFAATLKIMTGVIADLPDETRRTMMRKRMATLAAMEHSQRTVHMGHMLQGLADLAKDKRMAMRKAMMELMAELPSEQRLSLMRSMDEAQMPRGEAAA